MKKLLHISSLALCGILVSPFAHSAPLTAANIYWRNNFTGQQDMLTLAYWSTDRDTLSNPEDFSGMANWVLGKMWRADASLNINQASFMYIPNGTASVTVKGIYWDNVPAGTQAANLGIYNNNQTTTGSQSFTITDGITVEGGTSAGNTVTVRRRNNSGSFAVTVGEINVLNTGSVALGYSDAGQYLTSLSLTGGINLKGASSSSKSNLNIRTNSFSIAEGAAINLENATLLFGKATNESTGTINFAWCDVDLSSNEMTLKKDALVQYGDYADATIQTILKIGDVNLASSDVTAKFSWMSRNTAAKEFGHVRSTVAGAAGSKLTFYTNNSLATVKSMDVSVETLDLSAKLRVLGNYKNSFAGTAYVVYPNTGAMTNSYFNVDGTFETTGKMVFGKGVSVAATSFSFGGITGTAADAHITTNFVTTPTDVSLSNITLTGDGAYSTTTKITDMAADASAANKSGAISITKDGAGTQHLRGQTWYRGDTVVNSGGLYIRADLSGRDAGAQAWGVGSVILNGGEFGATGESGNIGTLYAQNLNFAGGAIAVDISGANSDLIVLTDTAKATVITLDAGETLNFLFNLENANLDTEYLIMEWDAGLGNLDFDLENDFYAEIAGRSDLTATFSYDANGGLNVSFGLIPEPAHYAALFGAVCLVWTLRRSRRR